MSEPLAYRAGLLGAFPSFEEAANVAVREFGRGPYLIGQVGAAPIGMLGHI
jgi:hypothetical protein